MEFEIKIPPFHEIQAEQVCGIFAQNGIKLITT